jgi:hypothetical protein
MVGVVRVGAVVHAPSASEYRDRLRRWSREAEREGDTEGVMSAAEIDAEVASREGALDLEVELFAVLSDRRRVVTEERHGSMGLDLMGAVGIAFPEHDDTPAPGRYDHLTPEHVEADVREELFMEGDTAADRWDRLVAALQEQDIGISAEELDRLPFSIELTEAVRERLRQLQAQ